MSYEECKHPECGNPVFSTGLCRKHYERERLETAAPCSILGCTEKSYRGTECVTHYRARMRSTHPACTVPNCGNPQKTLSSGLCEKHLFRYSRHGTVEQPRRADWGSREAHPLYKAWVWHRRARVGLCAEWKENFWSFVECVGERPERHMLRKKNTKEELGPNNWHWVETIEAKDKAERARLWRKANPDKAKNIDLRKSLGIDLPQYSAMIEQQKGVCALCSLPETGKHPNGTTRMLAVDHCHQTGKIRALLCSHCNKALGGFKDSPQLLRKAAEYIEKHKQCA